MIFDSFFFISIVLFSSATAMNVLLLFAYILRPLKMNTSKYFIPITAIQNIAYSLCIMLSMPRVVAWNFCSIVATTGPLNTRILGMVLLALVLLLFLLHVLTTANIFFYRYLYLCRSKLFALYSTSQGALLLAATNFVIIFNWMAHFYFGLWPTREVDAYSRVPMRRILGINLSTTAFIGFCVKPAPKYTQFIFIIDSAITMLFLTGAGIYWAIQINITLRKSSLSSHAKAMHRRMNSLLVGQTICPILFLHFPSILQHCMTYFGGTSDIIFMYGCHVLWALFPLFSPLITIVFLKEYRTWLLGKIGVKYHSSVLIVDIATVRMTSINARFPFRSRSL